MEPGKTCVDPVVCQALNSGIAGEAHGAAASRTRAWDNLTQAIATSLVVSLNTPSIIAAQGMRMLNGTPTMAPGNAPNANA